MVVGAAACNSSGTQSPPTQTKLGSVLEIAPEEVATFLEFVGTKGWYAHEIVIVDNDAQALVVRDGIDHEFTLEFEFANLPLIEHHKNVKPMIEKMGLFSFLVFAMENNLYAHEMGPVTPEEKVVLIYGDRGTEYSTEFFMTFENIIAHLHKDHKWTNQELLDGDYCEYAFSGAKVGSCRDGLTY